MLPGVLLHEVEAPRPVDMAADLRAHGQLAVAQVGDDAVMLLAGESSIREIIPFPMNKNAQDIMMGAPSTVEQKQLDELHIAIVGDVEKDD